MSDRRQTPGVSHVVPRALSLCFALGLGCGGDPGEGATDGGSMSPSGGATDGGPMSGSGGGMDSQDNGVGSGVSTSTNGGASASTSTGEDTPVGDWVPGITETVQPDLPGGEPVACEHNWTIRLLRPFPDWSEGHKPRRMYTASCDTDTPTPRLLSSYTVGRKDPGDTTGALTSSIFNQDTGALEVEATHHFPECKSMHGVASAADCSTVAVLCRIPNTATGEDHDPVASYSNADWITNENTCGNTMKMNDHIWLYEWPDGDLSRPPVKVIVHKSFGSWEFGENYLRYGENDDTYGIALKTTVGDVADGVCHEGDSYMVLDRANFTFTQRGWDWACATGHTIHNRPAYDPVTKKYGMLCSTDWNGDGTQGEVEVAFRREDQGKQVIQHIPRYDSPWIKGGAGPIVARDGGGFLGIIVAEPPPRGAGYDSTTPTELGLVTVDAEGALVGDVNWIARNAASFLSWPQLAPLGDDRYLLAWGEGYRVGTSENQADRDFSLSYPWSYWMMEIDGNGAALTEAAEVSTAGWGEVNEMVPFGDGRVAWTYVPEARRLPDIDEAPDCNQTALVHYVYTSATPPSG